MPAMARTGVAVAMAMTLAACSSGASRPAEPENVHAAIGAGTDVSGVAEAGSYGSDSGAAVACLAAGGQCVPCGATGVEPCPPAGDCMAVGFQDCGPSAACCLEFSGEFANPYVCNPDAGFPVIQASNYDQTCTVDTDCAGISEGNTCNACTFSCTNAAINVKALPQYHSATASLFPAAFNLCPSSCGGSEYTCCLGGSCHWGYPVCPFPGSGPVDSGPDSADAGAE
jgi:hypothetical protein